MTQTPRTYRTLLVSHDVLGAKMAGPGIRYYHLSRVLGRYTDLTLAIRPQNEQALAAIQASLPGVQVIAYTRGDWDSLKAAAEWAEIIILSPYIAPEMPQFATLPCALVMDGYDPLLIEWLTTLPNARVEEQFVQWYGRAMNLFHQYLHSDFFICATERQRYWWLGQLEVAGRINPYTYHQDPSLRNLVDVVPYGLPDTPPQHTRQVIKGVWPGIAPDDTVLLWGGGLWPWLDPMTAVQAIAHLHPTHPQLKLIFPGTIHPNPDVSQGMPVSNSQVYAYAAAQGLLDRAVFFGEWVPYADWPNVLLESDIALSLHHETAETQLAYRSRVLEYIWAGIPIIATGGDTTSELVTAYNLGKTVTYQDVNGVAQAILQLLNEPPATYQQGLAAAQRDLTWERAAQPLIQFCQNPRRAADRLAIATTGIPPGIPYYQTQILQLENLIAGYENGRFMRFMKTLHNLRARYL